MTPHKRLITFLLFLLMVLAVHSLAHGQVAAPALPPSSPQVDIPGMTTPDATFAPENPGAMQYGAPSRFGLGQIRSRIKQETALGNTTTTHVDGYYAGLRWATDSFAAGGEIVNLEDSDNSSDYSADVMNGAISFAVAKAIAFGAGLDTATIDSGNAQDKIRGTILGFSLNFDEKLFIGLALGRDYLNRDTGVDDFDSDRAVQKLGLAFRLGKTGQALHLEYYTISRDPHEDNNGFEFDEQDSSHIVVEGNLGNWVLSGHYADFQIDDMDGTTTVAELGWAPKKGLAVMGHYERTLAKTDSGLDTDVQATAISLAYQF